MNDLIEALKIFQKYTDAKFPTYAVDYILYVEVHPGDVSKEDTASLGELGFFPLIHDFYSYRFGGQDSI